MRSSRVCALVTVAGSTLAVGTAALAVGEAAATAAQCPEVLPHTCLPTSVPILQELDVSTPADCCAACEANPQCASWTLNTQQQKCHIRATFLDKKHGEECTSGHVPGRGPGPAPAPTPTPAPVGAKNVLLVVVDDLRPQLNSYNISVCGGKRQMHTPNLDQLASRSLLFRNAYTQYAVCSPSRNSFLSGRRPDSTLTWNFKDSFRTAPGGEAWVALPEYFKDHGYNTSGAGKTYHVGHPKNFDQPRSWTLPYGQYDQGLGFCGDHCACQITNESLRSDDSYANRTIDVLRSHRQNDIAPWFVAVGFIRPHVDWSAPPEFWELYPEDECGTDVAEHKTAPPTAPKIAWVDGGYADKKSGDVGPDYKFSPTVPVNDSVASFWRRGYYAAVSYMDWNVGRVLSALDELGYSNDTVVAFVADHGYQLGEHSMWEKYTNWELAARVPMMLSVPWKPHSHGLVSDALVELVDLYPSLAAAAGLPSPPTDCDNSTKYPGGFNGTCVEGTDMTPLLDEPYRDWKNAAFSQYARCDLDPSTGLYARCSGDNRDTIEVMGYSVRTAQYRFTEWFKFNDDTLRADFNSTVAMELYDHTNDAGNDFDAYDQENLADNSSFAVIVQQHREIIRSGWVHQRPEK